MPNYDMQFGVSEVARILAVDKDLVKSWAHHFFEYLNPKANPPKGIPRIFSADDLRVLSYIYMYWEDQPDFQAIRIGLNTESHFEEPYDALIAQVTPLFQDLPENLDESWCHGTVFGGMAEIGDRFALAESYKLAGDKLVEAALSSDEAFELICPIIYNYRHATELYLKATVSCQRETHDLLWLLQEFKKNLKSEFDAILPDWFENIILTFNDFDPNSTKFRYGGFIPGEFWLDLPHLKNLMDWLAESFQKIRYRRSSF